MTRAESTVFKLEADELELFIWNDSESYFEGLELVRQGKLSDSDWKFFVGFCVNRYRWVCKVTVRPVKGMTNSLFPKLRSDFVEHAKECEEPK